MDEKVNVANVKENWIWIKGIQEEFFILFFQLPVDLK